jgi:Domain of unknown function (DUF4372)
MTLLDLPKLGLSKTYTMSHSNISLFAQVLCLIERNLFSRPVNKHDSDTYHKGINSWTHLVSMLFMQLAGATSLRGISNCMRSATGNLNHLGVKRAPCKSTLSYIEVSANSAAIYRNRSIEYSWALPTFTLTIIDF